jgi:uncharacterized membrane protein YhaH (DUF805 family)
MTDTPRVYTQSQTRHFIRHYAEMVVAMVAGMVVLGLPAVAALGAAGMSMSELHNDAPALMLSLMGVTMTVPMVAWMRHRGHGRRPSAEMSAAMLVPTVGAIALLWAGLVEDLETLQIILHVVMLPSMLLAMLLRRDEYSHADARGPREVTA